MTLVLSDQNCLRVFNLTDFDEDKWQEILDLAEYLSWKAYELDANTLSCDALLAMLRTECPEENRFATEREGA